MWHFKMTNSPKNKKILAREILLFFSILLLNGLIFIFFHSRNYFYERKVISLQTKLTSINKQIDSLPVDIIKKIYDKLQTNFVVNYTINGIVYVIPKMKEHLFLTDYPTAKLQLPHKEGFSVSDTKKKLVLYNTYKTPNGSIVQESVLRSKYGVRFDELVSDSTLTLYTENPSTGFPIISYPMIFSDSSITEVEESDVAVAKTMGARIYSDGVIFDYVDLQKFKDLLTDSIYRNKFYITFYKVYDIGTKLSFDSKIDISLKLNKEITIRHQKLLDEKNDCENNLTLSKDKAKSNKTIWSMVLWTLIISLLIAYPIRLCFKIVKWSLTTLRKNAT